MGGGGPVLEVHDWLHRRKHVQQGRGGAGDSASSSFKLINDELDMSTSGVPGGE